MNRNNVVPDRGAPTITGIGSSGAITTEGYLRTLTPRIPVRSRPPQR